MEIKQLYTGCLAQGAYYIKCCNEAAIVDPLREVQQYIDLANADGVEIKYIFETHFHADFVSGHVTLAEKTGADIVFGPTAETAFKAITAVDGQRFKIGKIEIEVLHTPGHTMESSCFLVYDEEGKAHAIFSGDTVFLGDVGRPDLAQKAASMTMEELTGTLYDSIRTKIMPLADNVIIYPGHGAGSACGKNMSKETIGSIGHEKVHNYALRADMTKEEFIQEVCKGLPAPFEYFGFNVQMNKNGYKSIDEVIKSGTNMLSAQEFENAANATEATILDVRHQTEFIKGFIPQSIFIGIDGGFAPWVGAVLADVRQPILLVVEPSREEEVITRLSRVGFDNVVGILDGGYATWAASGKEVDNVKTIEPEALAKNVDAEIFDVRKTVEFGSEHIVDAIHTPFKRNYDSLRQVPSRKEVLYALCGGYRSVIANSILKKNGIHTAVDVLGGFGRMKNTDLPRTNYVCPSTL